MRISVNDHGPLISVVVPTHNRPDLLKRALLSVVAQTLQDFEVLVINDGGPSLPSSYAELDPGGRISVLSREVSGGAAAARNEGLRAARGRYIAYLDDDDIFLPEHLQTLVSALQRGSQRLAYSDPRRAFLAQDGRLEIMRSDLPYCRDYDRRQLLHRNYIPTLCIVHERALLDEVGYFNEAYPVLEDWDLWCRMSEKTDFVRVPVVTCEYLVRNDSAGLSTGRAHDFPRLQAEIMLRNNTPLGGADFAADYFYRACRGVVERRVTTTGYGATVWALETLLEFDPADARIHCLLAVMLIDRDDAEQGDRLRATEILQRVIDALPSLTFPRTVLGNLLLQDGKPEEALRLLSGCNLDSGRAWLLQGDALMETAAFEEAEVAYRRAATLGDVMPLDVIARLTNLKLFQEACKDQRPVSGLAPASGGPHLGNKGHITVVGRAQIPQRVVPVLGFHRSGTSMFTYMLQRMGVDLGGPLLQPARDNPRGFWEHATFLAVNQKLLAGSGCDTDGFGPLPTLLAASQTVADFSAPALEGIRQLIEQNFAGGTWAFKDPRTVVTLPFWQRCFSLLGTEDIRPIVVVRSPLSCAASLLKRGEHSPAVPLIPSGEDPTRYVVQLWATYARLLEQTVPEGALWLHHEDLIHPERCQQALALCAEYLNLRPIAITPAAASVAQDLIHHRKEEVATGVPEADELYARQRARAVLPSAGSTPSRGSSTHMRAVSRPTRNREYCIYVARGSQSTYARPFEEVALALHYGLRKLDIEAPIVDELWESDNVPIVLGGQLLASNQARALPASSILYNLEQVSRESRWFNEQYLWLMKNHRLWDYSERNLAGLRELGLGHAELCPIGTEDELAWLDDLPETERDIDVLFYGAINPRRRHVLAALVNRGLNVTVLGSVYGADRDHYIRRAKLVVNIHFYEAQVLELARLSYLLVNGVCVVSEPGTDDLGTADAREGMEVAAYDALVDTCERLVRSPTARRALGRKARAVAARRRQSDFLKPLLDNSVSKPGARSTG